MANSVDQISGKDADSGVPLAQEGSLTQAAAPVSQIPGDPEADNPQDGWALCLSGGGYRAMLFHTGVLWRLNDAGLLPQLKRVSSVSGGSIVAARLGLQWRHLGFD